MASSGLDNLGQPGRVRRRPTPAEVVIIIQDLQKEVMELKEIIKNKT